MEENAEVKIYVSIGGGMTISDPLWDEREASVNHQHFNMLKTHTEVQ